MLGESKGDSALGLKASREQACSDTEGGAAGVWNASYLGPSFQGENGPSMRATADVGFVSSSTSTIDSRIAYSGGTHGVHTPGSHAFTLRSQARSHSGSTQPQHACWGGRTDTLSPVESP